MVKEIQIVGGLNCVYKMLKCNQSKSLNWEYHLPIGGIFICIPLMCFLYYSYIFTWEIERKDCFPIYSLAVNVLYGH